MRILPKQKLKDSVFTHLFGDPHYTIQLYRALHPEDTTAAEADIRSVTIENLMTDNLYNDLGFVVGDRLLILAESQSRWDPNIVARCLIYAASTLRNYIVESGQNLHQHRLLKLPKPELYVIFPAGNASTPKTISFRDSYMKGGDSSLDVTVYVITDSAEGDIISQYVRFTKVYNEQYRLHGRTTETIRETLRICKNEKILDEYLKHHEKEVEDIMETVFSQERATRFMLKKYGAKCRSEGKAEGRAEGKAEGRAEGRAEGKAEGKAEGIVKGRAEGRAEILNTAVHSMRQMGMSTKKIAEALQISEAKVMSILG